MESCLKLVARLFFVFIPIFASGIPTPNGHAFSPGEKLTYRVQWGIFPAGKIVLEFSPFASVDAVPCYHFVMTAETNSFVDNFFKVRDRYESFIDLNMRNSLLFKKKQHEGKLKTDIVVKFDWENQTTTYSNFNRDLLTLSIFPGSFDPLSFFYKLRNQEFTVNQEYLLPVADGKEAFLGKVRITKKCKIKTRLGKYVTYLVEPDMESYGWIFRQTQKTKLKIWFSDDENKFPVKFSTRVTFGRFTCELVAVEKLNRQAIETK